MTEPALPRPPRHFRGPAWVAKAVALHEQGLTNTEIAEKLKLSQSAISQQLRRNRDRLLPEEWFSPLALEQWVNVAISQQTFHRWAKVGLVPSVVTTGRWRLHRPSVVKHIVELLDRPCKSCGRPVDSVRARDRVCIVCQPPEEGQEWESKVRVRWVELGKRLRDG